MPKLSRNRVAGRHFTWNLFARDGVWYADGRHNRPNVGKHSLGTTDRDAALRALHELDQRKAVERGLVLPRPADDAIGTKLSIRQGWERYLAHAARPGVLNGASAATVQRYRAVRDKHVAFCAKRGLTDWSQINQATLADYIAWLNTAGYSDNTAYTEGTLVKQVVIRLIEEKVLPESSRIRLKLKRSQVSDTYCYTREQLRAMLDLCRSEPTLGWLGDVITALALTGMRIGELAALRWADVDLAHDLIHIADNRHSARAKRAGAVRTTKGRRSRQVDIHPQLREVLLRLAQGAKHGEVFRGLQGGKLDPDKVLKVLKRDVLGPLKERFPTAEGEIGFEHGGVHSFRHYFVTEAFLGGATDGEVRDWVGHRDSRIVERYRHLRGRAAKQTMNRLKFFDVAVMPSNEQPNGASDNGASKGLDGTDDDLNNNGQAEGPNGSESRQGA